MGEGGGPERSFGPLLYIQFSAQVITKNIPMSLIATTGNVRGNFRDGYIAGSGS